MSVQNSSDKEEPYWMGKLVRSGQTVRDLVIKDLNDNVSTSQAKNVKHVRESNVSLQVIFNPTWTIVDKLDEAQALLKDHQAKCQRMGISLRPSAESLREAGQEGAGKDGGEEREEEEDDHKKKVVLATIEKIHREKRAQDQERKLRKRIKEIRQEFVSECCSRPDGYMTQVAFLPGPVGELPLHVCFLRGQWRLGMEVASKLYSGKNKISLPFANDMHGWKSCPQVWNRISGWADGGLYTGETALHIAIICKKDRLVRELLKLGADMSARAVGVFFQGKKTFVNKSGAPPEKGEHQQHLKDQADRIDHHRHRRSDGNLEPNEASTCDYGQYPLSFAASVGALDCCRALRRRAIEIAELHNELPCFELIKAFPVPEPKDKQKAMGEVERELRQRLRKFESDTASRKKVRKGTSNASTYKGDGSSIGSEQEDAPFAQIKKFQPHDKMFTLTEEREGAGEHEHPDVEDEDPEGAKTLRDAEFREKKKNACVWALLYARDSNGNTALHMAVKYGQVPIIDWLVEQGGRDLLMEINDDGLTPFTLSVALGYVNIFRHILEHHVQEIRWSFGTAQMTKTSLEQIDTYKIDGSSLHKHGRHFQSVVQLIVKNRIVEFANDELFNRLIHQKWDKFARSLYLRITFMPFIFLMVCQSVVVAIRGNEVDRTWKDGVAKLGYNGVDPVSPEDRNNIRSCYAQECYADVSSVDGKWAAASFTLELVTMVWGVVFMCYKAWKLKRFSRRDLSPGKNKERNFEFLLDVLFFNLSSVLSTITALFFVLTLICRLMVWEDFEMAFLASSTISMWMLFLVFLMPFKAIGVVVITMYRMFFGDVLKFIIVFAITTLAYTFAMYAMMQQSHGDSEEIRHMDQVYGAFLSLLWVAFGEVNLMGPYALARSGDWVQLLMVTYVLIQALLLLNLLIAMMLQTFTASTSDVYKTWIFPFAALVLRYEEMLPRDQRSKPHYRCGDPEIVLTNESTASKDEGDQDASALSKDPLGLQAKGTPAPWPSLLSVLRNPFVHIFELGFGQGHKSSDDELMERMYAQWNCCPFYEMRVENLPITEEAMEDEAAKEQLRLAWQANAAKLASRLEAVKKLSSETLPSLREMARARMSGEGEGKILDGRKSPPPPHVNVINTGKGRVGT